MLTADSLTKKFKEGEGIYIRNQVINYTPEDLAKDISVISCYKEDVVAGVLKGFEEALLNHFLETDRRTDIAIRPFKGFKLTAITKRCVAEKNLGKDIPEDAEDKIIIKASFLRTFKDKVRLRKREQ